MRMVMLMDNDKPMSAPETELDYGQELFSGNILSSRLTWPLRIEGMMLLVGYVIVTVASAVDRWAVSTVLFIVVQTGMCIPVILYSWLYISLADVRLCDSGVVAKTVNREVALSFKRITHVSSYRVLNAIVSVLALVTITYCNEHGRRRRIRFVGRCDGVFKGGIHPVAIFLRSKASHGG